MSSLRPVMPWWRAWTVPLCGSWRRARARRADYGVPDLLPPAREDLGLLLWPAGGAAGQEAVVRALAGRMVAGELTPREPAVRVRRRFGYGLPLAVRPA
ncbi:hypothetical protein ACIP79_19420 [Streptomyces sp. NPDC088747]|uniref:hypothetical protein n=1 Tax=Streptomyces sp. NPDC088747 TaxID=3365886 RepID=UPI003807061D